MDTTIEPIDFKTTDAPDKVCAPTANTFQSLPMTKEQAREFLNRPANSFPIAASVQLPPTSTSSQDHADSCPDCGVAKYKLHDPFCTVTHCRGCGMRVPNCFCAVGPLPASWRGHDVVDEACQEFGFYCKPGSDGYVVCSARSQSAEIDFCRLYSSGEAVWNRDDQWELVKKRNLKTGHDSYGCLAARSKSNPEPVL